MMAAPRRGRPVGQTFDSGIGITRGKLYACICEIFPRWLILIYKTQPFTAPIRITICSKWIICNHAMRSNVASVVTNSGSISTSLPHCNILQFGRFHNLVQAALERMSPHRETAFEGPPIVIGGGSHPLRYS